MIKQDAGRGKEAALKKRPITPTYIVFYILFFPDTWRILAGIVVAVLLAPKIAPADLAPAGRAMLHVMVAGIGWTVTARPARWITVRLKAILLGGKAP
ncbi:MAG: hypothetical protein JEZ11_06130 [Desulfobacterales bacterium]|nr:hypothetical protein [Desulfobacterales bacterium]